MAGFGGHHHQALGLNQANIFDMNNFDTTGGLGGMQGFTSMQTFSGSMGGAAPGMCMQSSSTSTRFVNGKKVRSQNYFQNWYNIAQKLIPKSLQKPLTNQCLKICDSE